MPVSPNNSSIFPNQDLWLSWLLVRLTVPDKDFFLCSIPQMQPKGWLPPVIDLTLLHHAWHVGSAGYKAHSWIRLLMTIRSQPSAQDHIALWDKLPQGKISAQFQLHFSIPCDHSMGCLYPQDLTILFWWVTNSRSITCTDLGLPPGCPDQQLIELTCTSSGAFIY